MMIRFALLLLFCLWMQGCSYTMRGQERPFFEVRNIHTLYVTPVKNNSYKAGVEIMIYNRIRKRFSQWGYVKIIDSAERADAILSAVVQTATLDPQAVVKANQLAGGGNGPSNIQIATGYNVTLGVAFDLIDSKKDRVWNESVSRSKSFQAATYFGALGTTSALINESEFDNTLGLLADSVISDVEESLNAVF